MTPQLSTSLDPSGSVYLDYASQTPVDPEVSEAMLVWLHPNRVGNPSATTHSAGRRTAAAVSRSCAQLAALIHAEPEEIIWTSGATEANNLALHGVWETYGQPGSQILVAATEHDSVLACAAALERRGTPLGIIPVDRDGQVILDALAELLDRNPTTLVSVAHVNNETGTIQNIPALAQLTHNRGALLHVDAAQSLGKLPIDVGHWNADLVAFSAHKSYGPAGIGALYTRRRPRVRLTPLMRGGAQQAGTRPGSLAVHQIVGFGTACAIAERRMAADAAHCVSLSGRLRDALGTIDTLRWNSTDSGAAWIQNLSLPGGNAEALIAAHPRLAVSAGSACHAGRNTPSHVLLAMGRTPAQAAAAVRISFGRFTTAAEIDSAVEAMRSFCRRPASAGTG